MTLIVENCSELHGNFFSAPECDILIGTVLQLVLTNQKPHFTTTCESVDRIASTRHPPRQKSASGQILASSSFFIHHCENATCRQSFEKGLYIYGLFELTRLLKHIKKFNGRLRIKFYCIRSRLFSTVILSRSLLMIINIT